MYFILLATVAVPALRRCYRKPIFYLALALGLLIVTPNLLWLWQHNFAAFRWVDSQVHPRWNGHIFTSLLAVFYPSLFLWGIIRLCGGHFAWPPHLAKRVLGGIYLLPLGIITLWFSFNVGGRLTEWLQPFFVLVPALLIMCAQSLQEHRVKIGIRVLCCLPLLVMSGYAMVMMLNIKNAGQKFSGVKEFTRVIDAAWQDRYPSPLGYVGGGYLSQWLTFYIPSHPQTLTPWSDEARPNIYNAHLRPTDSLKHGAVLVGEVGQTCAQTDFRLPLAPGSTAVDIDRQQVFFQADPRAQKQPVCIAFIPPHAHITVSQGQTGPTPD